MGTGGDEDNESPACPNASSAGLIWSGYGEKKSSAGLKRRNEGLREAEYEGG